ncbi:MULTISPECIES: hypothetical protein [Paenibacillus]|uniref:hypothetical protein n=1 Tax=Paenibacillus TaxID=44249 RepID=UPI00088EB0DD|nr:MULTISPECIES: hypothetical protein [Paenibacillus]GCL72808.1 hypothetical protein PN4B1_27350 [Paenibacillus naphthalenovorans]SDI08676.1 hypothetical protein SAMN05421868_10378 [Paenibacillus naphthalenovorans]
MIRGSQVDQSNIVRRKFKVNWHEEEARTKLHILISLARSQRALSRILESVADVAEKTEPAGERLVEQMEALSKYQRQIAVKMIGIKIRKKTSGIPQKPWINQTLVHYRPQTISAKE